MQFTVSEGPYHEQLYFRRLPRSEFRGRVPSLHGGDLCPISPVAASSCFQMEDLPEVPGLTEDTEIQHHDFATQPHSHDPSRPRHDMFSGALHGYRPRGALRMFHAGNSAVGVGDVIQLLIRARIPFGDHPSTLER